MDELKLQVAKRNVLGKKNRFLRRQGVTPVHIFGHGVESRALQCDTALLKKLIAYAGMTRLISLKINGDKEPKNVFVREIQRDALSKQLLHIDFYQVQKGEKITVAIPIVLVGESLAMKGKGRILTHGITRLNVECLPENVPPRIEVDISPLKELEQAIQVKDIALGPDITVHADPDQLVVKVSEVIIKEVVEEVVAAPEAEAAAAAEAEAKAEGEAGQPKAGPPSEQK